MRQRHSIYPVPFMTAVLLCVHCGGSAPTAPTATGSTPSQAPQPSYSISSFITGVSGSDGGSGSLRVGSAPPAGSGPTVQPTANNSVINGGSNQVRLRSSTTFQTVYVYVGGVAGGVGGYWDLRLASPTTDTTIVITLARSIPAAAFDAVYGIASASGAVGSYSAVQTRVLAAATGDVQVSASWDAASDVDLHVVDPRGEEIYYGHPSSASGGQLDLDSNAGCTIDNKNNENIRWPVGRAPAGTYIVRLDYWSNCGGASTNYVVTVNNGGNTQTFRGAFTGSGDFGGSGSGRLITTFSRAGSALLPEAGFLELPVPLSSSALQKLFRSAGALPLRNSR